MKLRLWLAVGSSSVLSGVLVVRHRSLTALTCLFVCLFSPCVDTGASDAADWAIARSLSALRNAEETGELEQGKSEEGEVSISTVGEEGSQDRSV